MAENYMRGLLGKPFNEAARDNAAPYPILWGRLPKEAARDHTAVNPNFPTQKRLWWENPEPKYIGKPVEEKPFVSELKEDAIKIQAEDGYHDITEPGLETLMFPHYGLSKMFLGKTGREIFGDFVKKIK